MALAQIIMPGAFHPHSVEPTISTCLRLRVAYLLIIFAGIAPLAACNRPDYHRLQQIADEHRRALQLEGQGCRGVQRLLLGQDAKGCLPGPVLETQKSEALNQQLRTLETSSDPWEQLWAGVNGQRAGLPLAWMLGLRLQHSALETISTPGSEACNEDLFRLNGFRPAPVDGVHAAQWEAAMLALKSHNDAAAQWVLATEDRLQVLPHWTVGKLEPLTNSADGKGMIFSTPIHSLVQAAIQVDQQWTLFIDALRSSGCDVPDTSRSNP